MKRTTTIKALALSAAALCGFTVTPAMAQNANYAPGDLVLFFQQQGGTNTLMLNVGAATTFRDATSNIFNIANIGTELSNAGTGFGASWYDLTNLYWGAAGVFNNSTSSTTVTNGDPGRTLYVSRDRTAVGTEGVRSSTPWSIGTDGGMTSTANAMIQQVNRMETIATTDRLVETTATSFIDNQNLFLGVSPFTPTVSFGGFTSGGVLGDFGAGSFGTVAGVAAEGALDLYRILAVNPVGTVEPTHSPIRNGYYQGSFVIEQDGDVSFIVAVPEPTTMGASLALGLVAAGMRRRRRVTA